MGVAVVSSTTAAAVVSSTTAAAAAAPTTLPLSPPPTLPLPLLASSATTPASTPPAATFPADRDLHLPGCRRRQGLQGGLPLREVRLWLPLRLPQDPPVRPPPPPHFRLQEDLRALLSWTS